MRRNRVFLLGLVCVISACGTPEDDTNNANNVAQDAGQGDVEPDAPDAPDMRDGTDAGVETDAATDLGDDASGDTSDMAVDALNCAATSWAPYTLPATQGGTITFDFECTGSGDLPGTLSYTFSYPDGATTKGGVEFPAKVGTFSVSLDVPARPWIAGQTKVDFEVAGDGIEFAQATPPTFVFHQSPAEADANWSGLTKFVAPPPDPSAYLLEQRAGDFNEDGVVDFLAVWRWSDKVGVETHLGPNFLSGGRKEIVVGVTDGELTGQNIRVGRGKAAVSDKATALYWYAATTTGTLKIARAAVVAGVLSDVKLYETEAPIATVDAIHDVEVVDGPGVADGLPGELQVLYTGDQAGKKVFSIVRTDTAAQKVVLVTERSFFGTLDPASVASGQAATGMTRAASNDPRLPISVADTRIWTLSPGAALDSLSLGLFSPTDGAPLTSWLVTNVKTSESKYDVDFISGETNAAMVVSSVNPRSGAPFVRSFEKNGDLFAGQTDHFLPPNPSVSWTPPTFVGTAGGEASRFVSSRFYPVLNALAQKHGITGNPLFTTPIDSEVAPGRVMAVMPLWTGGNAAYKAAATPTLGGKASLGVTADRSIAVAPTRAGLNVTAVATDDLVISLTNPVSGTSLGHIGGGGSVVIRDDSSVPFGDTPFGVGGSGGGNFLHILNDTSTGTDFVFEAVREAAGDTTLRVWHLGATGLVGPAKVTVPAQFGVFSATAAASDAFEFVGDAGSGDSVGPLTSFTLKPSELAAAAAAGDSLAVVFDGAVNTLVANVAARNDMVSRVDGAVPFLELSAGAPACRVSATASRRVALGSLAIPDTHEAMAVIPVADGDACPFQLVHFSSDRTTAPTVLVDSAMEGCWDLPTPTVKPPFWGLDCSQNLTVSVADASSRSTWTWAVTAWARVGGDLIETPFAQFALRPGQIPRVDATDVNGDGLSDVVITVIKSAGYPADTTDVQILLNDGLGGVLGTPAMPNLTGSFRAFPSAGGALGAGQVACGQGLMCNLGTGTRTTSSQAGTKAELL